METLFSCSLNLSRVAVGLNQFRLATVPVVNLGILSFLLGSFEVENADFRFYRNLEYRQ